MKSAGIQTKLNLIGDRVGVAKPELERRVVKGQLTLSKEEKEKLKKHILMT